MKKSDYRQQIKDMSAEQNEMLQRISELNDKLNLANSIVGKQIKAFDDMCENYEKQLKVQDKELARRLTIIHYLETKALKVFE